MKNIILKAIVLTAVVLLMCHIHIIYSPVSAATHTCPGGQHWDSSSSKCVCPSNLYTTSDNRCVAQTACPPYHDYNAKTNTCCPEGNRYDAGTQQCVAYCTDPQYEWREAGGGLGECVRRCSMDQTWNGNLCVCTSPTECMNDADACSFTDSNTCKDANGRCYDCSANPNNPTNPTNPTPPPDNDGDDGGDDSGG